MPSKDEAPDFRPGDIVGEIREEYGGGKIHTVKSRPILKDGEWWMVVRAIESYSSNYVERCKEYVLVERPQSRSIRFKEKLSKIGVPNMNLTRPAKVTLIVLAVVAVVGLWSGGNYNSLVTSRNAVDNSWSKVESDYQRRLDLIDNYVSVAKGAQKQEVKVFGQIADARKQYNSAQTTDQKAQAASQIESINIVPRLQEAYPELKSNQTLNNLATEIASTENSIRDKRNVYNDTVTNYNNNVSRFPKSIFAGMFNFEKRTLFKAENGASKAPHVNFNE